MIGTAACKSKLGRHLQPYGEERAGKPEERYEGQGKSSSSVCWGRMDSTGTEHQYSSTVLALHQSVVQSICCEQVKSIHWILNNSLSTEGYFSATQSSKSSPSG